MRAVKGVLIVLAASLSLCAFQPVWSASEPTTEKGMQSVAERQLKRNQYEAAKATLQKAIEAHPDWIFAHVLLAKALFQLKEYKASAAEYATAQAAMKDEQGPIVDRLIYDKAQAEYFGEMYAEAINDLTSLVQRRGPSEDVYLQRASAYDSLGKPDMAIADIGEAIKLRPKSADAYLKRALLYKYLNNQESAMTDFNTAVKLNPALATWRASFHRDQGRQSAAIEDFTTAIEANKGCGRAAELCNRALVYADIDSHRKAIKDWNEALKLEPERHDFYANRGTSYFGVSDFKHAIADLNEAVKRSPEKPDYFFRRAEAETADGQKEAALKDYDEAIRLQKNKKEAAQYYYRRALVAAELNRHDQALADLSNACVTVAENADFWFDLGIEYEATEKWKDADENFSKAIGLRQNFASAYKHRAKVRSRMGNNEAALEDLQTSMKLYDAEHDMFGMSEVKRLIAKMQK